MDATGSGQSSDLSHNEPSFNLRPDEVTLHLIASGLIKLSEQAQSEGFLEFPYPPPLQRGLNRLALACLQRGRQPPQSLMELLDWCRKPLADWGLDLPDGSIDNAECLLDGQIPTATCEAWARSGEDIEADLSEERLLSDVLNTCRSANDPQSYVAFRRLLIERPIMDSSTYQMMLADSSLELLINQVRAAYEPAPLSAARNGFLETCAGCDNLLLRTRDDRWVCEDDLCRASGHMEPRHRFSVHNNVVWLRRDLRRYIAAPGRAELRLAEQFERLGVKVELWPEFDKYDLRVTFPDAEVWAIDVKDWRNPFLLARHVNRTERFPLNPPWNRAFFVFPDARRQQRADYVNAFKAHCHVLSDRIDSCFEGDVLRRAKRKLEQLKGIAHA